MEQNLDKTNEPRFNKILVITNTTQKRKHKIYLDITNKCHYVTERYLMNSIRSSFGGTSIQRSAKGLGKFVRYIEGSLYRKPRFNEFLGKQSKCSLYRATTPDKTC